MLIPSFYDYPTEGWSTYFSTPGAFLDDYFSHNGTQHSTCSLPWRVCETALIRIRVAFPPHLLPFSK